MKKSILVGVGIVVFVIAVAAFWFWKNNDEPKKVKVLDPLDVTIEFYNEWLNALQSTTTNPFTVGLIDSPILSGEVRNDIQQKNQNRIDGDTYPLICQPKVPSRMGGKTIFANETEAQIMMMARGEEEKSGHLSIATLKLVENKWQIVKVECTQGEVAPFSEFSFEKRGFLLKSVQPPLNPEFWHLVYEENGQLGYTVPLIFDGESLCTSLAGEESVCNPEQFIEASKVFVQSDMTESGAQVKRMKFE